MRCAGPQGRGAPPAPPHADAPPEARLGRRPAGRLRPSLASSGPVSGLPSLSGGPSVALLGGHTVPLAAGTAVTLGSLAGSRVLPLPLAGHGAAGSPRHGHV